MIIASEHAEGQGGGAGKDVEERFLLGGVALEGRYIVGRDIEGPPFVEADLADASLPLVDKAAVAAGIAADIAIRELLVKLPFFCQDVNLFGQADRHLLPTSQGSG